MPKDTKMTDDNAPKPVPPEHSQSCATPVQGVPAYPTVHPDCARAHTECQRWRDEQGRVIKGLEAVVAEHKLRLENGTRVFSDIKTEIGAVRGDFKELSKSIAPKPIDWFRILTWAFAALITILGGWWGLSSKFSERPTTGEVRSLLQTHNENGHPVITTEIRAMREEQVLQKADLRSVRETIDETRADVKEIKRAVGVGVSGVPRPPTR